MTHSGITFLLLTLAALQSTDMLTVHTPSGYVTGIGVNVTGLQGATTYQFQRIPFAKPPLGDLRFAKPQPFGKWNGTLDGTEFGPSCIQTIDPNDYQFLPNINISEGCLFLNIYLPRGLDKAKNKTVMVWIHGGGYTIGQGMIYDPSYLAAKTDVIVITMNYRLNMFGFLTLGDDMLKGNYGLWDQIMALQWVHDNIYSFGGDPNSVTIFGENSGRFSVALLALIPSNKGLFHRVIAQSGVANSFYSLTRIGVLATRVIGRADGCNSSDSKTFLTCLRAKSADEILTAMDTVLAGEQKEIHMLIGLAPVVDNELLHDLPEHLMKNTSSEAAKFFRSLDIIVGNVNSEGSLVIGSLKPSIERRFKFNTTEGVPYEIFCGEIVQTLVSDYYGGNPKVKDAICNEYGEMDSETEQARRLVQMQTDLFFLAPSVSTLRYHGKLNSQTTQYQYVFAKGNVPYSEPRPSWFRGAAHAFEIFYLFGIRDLVKLNRTVTNEDLILSDRMVTYWSNFAKTGYVLGTRDKMVMSSLFQSI